MVCIPVRKRDDGRFEAEGVSFDPPTYASGGIYPVDPILRALFKRWPPPASEQEAAERRFYLDVRPQILYLKTCDDCSAFYLDARSNKHRAWNAKRRCGECFARQRYRYVQRARAWRRKTSTACAHCGAPLSGRSDRKFCSGRCRQRAHRAH